MQGDNVPASSNLERIDGATKESKAYKTFDLYVIYTHMLKSPLTANVTDGGEVFTHLTVKKCPTLPGCANSNPPLRSCAAAGGRHNTGNRPECNEPRWPQGGANSCHFGPIANKSCFFF